MQFNKKIIIYIRKIKERLCLSAIIEFFVIIVILTIFGIIIGIKNDQNKELKTHEALLIFTKIDDICHKQFAEMQATGNPHRFTGTEEFLRIDSGYHHAETIEEKFKRAKELDIFAHQVDTWLHEISGFDSAEEITRDQKYHEINSMFDKIK